MTSDNDLLASDPGSSAPASSDFVDSPVDAVSTTSGSRNVTYKLDRAGNRTSVADSTKATAAGYTPNVLNEYISSVGGSTITNNNQHQISLYRTVNYSYINDERLSTATSGINVYQLHYDALGRCVKRIVNGVTNFYIYDGEKAILEYSSAGAIIGRNLYGKGIDEVLMRTDTAVNSGQPFYYQQDHEGSVTHLTDGGGNVTEKYQYDAFGAPTIYPPQPGATPIPASAYKNRFLFTGREYSAMFGFYEYRARAYHPTLGRFTSEDPKLFDAGDYNLYRYCHNDPLDMTDPMGLAVELYVKPPYIGFSPMEGDAARIGGYFATKQAFQQAAQQALSMAQIAGAGGPNVNWRDTGNNNIRQPYVYGNDGRPLLARTYAEIQATGDANKDGSLKTLNVEFKIDAKYATTAGPNSQRFTQATEPIHERELRAWGMDSGRDLARSIVNKYSGSAQQAVTRANAALQGELRIKAWESHVLHDFPRPWGLGDHLTGHPYDW